MRTTFASEYSPGGELQAGDDNVEGAICGTEGNVINDERGCGVGSFNLMSNPEECTQILTRKSPLDLVSQHAGLVGALSTEAMDIDVDWPIDVCPPTGSNAALPRRSLNCADWAWAMSLEYSSNIQQYGDNTIANMMEHMDLQPLFESPMQTITPLEFPYGNGIPSISLDTDMDGLQVDAVATDGDTTIPSVENFLTCLLMIRCGSFSIDVLKYASEMKYFRQPRLIVPINSDLLTNEIEDLLCWIISSCQRAVAQGQIDKEIFDGQALLSIPVHQRSSRDRHFPVHRTATQGETLIETLESRALHMFTIELSIAGTGCYPVGPDVITLCSIPNHRRRTTGLLVSFALNTPPFGARISPHIRTFNVVPTGSSIITSIRENDLERVQKLFAEGQASPLDVDSRGNSLLQVSERHSSGKAHADSNSSTPCSEVTLRYSDFFSVVELVSNLLDSL